MTNQPKRQRESALIAAVCALIIAAYLVATFVQQVVERLAA